MSFNSIRSLLFNPLVAGPLGGGLIVSLAYFDAKYRDIEREGSTYINLFVVSTLIFATLIHFVLEENNPIDAFLEQDYDTNPIDFIPKTKGGRKIVNDILNSQVKMKGPPKHIMEMMNSLKN